MKDHTINRIIHWGLNEPMPIDSFNATLEYFASINQNPKIYPPWDCPQLTVLVLLISNNSDLTPEEVQKIYNDWEYLTIKTSHKIGWDELKIDPNTALYNGLHLIFREFNLLLIEEGKTQIQGILKGVAGIEYGTAFDTNNLEKVFGNSKVPGNLTTMMVQSFIKEHGSPVIINKHVPLSNGFILPFITERYMDYIGPGTIDFPYIATWIKIHGLNTNEVESRFFYILELMWETLQWHYDSLTNHNPDGVNDLYDPNSSFTGLWSLFRNTLIAAGRADILAICTNKMIKINSKHIKSLER